MDPAAVPLPASEAERLAALHALGVLDAPAEAAFDELVELAAELLDVPIAAVNLVDSDRQWTLAGVGLVHGEQAPRQESLCSRAIVEPHLPLIVSDALTDERFVDNAFVRAGLRFYAGVPLLNDEGHGLGTLCVADHHPRTLDARQVRVLVTLARRAAAEIALRREKLRLEDVSGQLAAVLRHAPDAFVAIDRHGRITEWNARAEAIFGYPRDHVLGACLTGLIVPEELRDAHEAGLARYVATGESRVIGQTLELPALRADGRRITIELTLAAVGQGEQLRFNAFARDVTERRRAEDEARATREFQRALLESLEEGIVACDAEGRLSLFNRASRELHGVDQEDLPPEAWTEHYDLLGPDGRTPLPTEGIPLVRAFAGEHVRGAELVIAARGRAPRTLLANGRPIRDEQGNPLGAVVAMHDITERRRADQLKDEFIALVSHELRTPLASIVGYTELLREDDEERGDGDALRGRWLAVLERNAHRLERLVGDLLFVAQLEASELSFDLRPCDLAALAHEAVEAAAPRAAAAGVDLALDAGDGAVVVGDADRLGQALDNLLSNAIKYTPAGGRVRLRLSIGPTAVRVAVEDTGIGIAAADRDRLFDRFFRAPVAAEQQIPGVGLGLTIVRAIAAAHGATIDVASTEGAGSTFTLELPVAATARVAA